MARKSASAAALTTDTALYTCPAGYAASVEVVVFSADHDARGVSATLLWHDESAAATYELETIVLEAGESVDVGVDLTLEEGDVLYVKASEAGRVVGTVSVDLGDVVGAALEDHEVIVGAVGTAGNDLNTNIAVVRYAGVVSAVGYVPASAITGQNTNTRKVQLVNKGQAGAGTTVVATLQFNQGVDAAAADEKAVTLSGTPADLAVAAGDVLQWQSVHVLTGITDPGGIAHVVIDKA